MLIITQEQKERFIDVLPKEIESTLLYEVYQPEAIPLYKKKSRLTDEELIFLYILFHSRYFTEFESTLRLKYNAEYPNHDQINKFDTVVDSLIKKAIICEIGKKIQLKSTLDYLTKPIHQTGVVKQHNNPPTKRHKKNGFADFSGIGYRPSPAVNTSEKDNLTNNIKKHKNDDSICLSDISNLTLDNLEEQLGQHYQSLLEESYIAEETHHEYENILQCGTFTSETNDQGLSDNTILDLYDGDLDFSKKLGDALLTTPNPTPYKQGITFFSKNNKIPPENLLPYPGLKQPPRKY